jgi:hypothetical protein
MLLNPVKSPVRGRSGRMFDRPRWHLLTQEGTRHERHSFQADDTACTGHAIARFRLRSTPEQTVAPSDLVGQPRDPGLPPGRLQPALQRSDGAMRRSSPKTGTSASRCSRPSSPRARSSGPTMPTARETASANGRCSSSIRRAPSIGAICRRSASSRRRRHSSCA